MTAALAAKRKQVEWIIATIVAVAVCAPVFHLLINLVSQRVPPAHTLDAITSALGSGTAVGTLDVKFASPPLPSQQDPRDRALSLALADRLSVEPGAVRVAVAKPSRPVQRQNSHAAEQTRIADARHIVSAMKEMPNQIEGDFTAALRMEDGRWRVVRPSSK